MSFFALIENDRAELREAAKDRARTQALMLAEHAARTLESVEISLQAVVEDAFGMDWRQIASSKALWERARKRAARLSSVEGLWLYDRDGQLRLSSLSYPAPSIDASERDFFIDPRERSDNIFIGDLTTGNGREATFRLSQRLQTDSGAFRGVASATIDADYFSRFYASIGLPRGSSAILFSLDDFQPLAQLAPPRNSGIPPPDPAAMRRLVAGENGATVREGDRVASWRRVPNFPLAVEVVMPFQEARWHTLVAIHALPAAAAVAALGVLTWIALRQAGQERAFQERLAARVAERTQAFEQANAKLEAVIHELHHRVNNNLQIIESLLTLAGSRVHGKQAKAAITPSIGRVHTIGLVHNALYGSGNLTEVPFGDLLTALASQLAELHGVHPEDIRVSGINPSLGLETAVPLALIVHEALSNVLQHAFPTGGVRADITFEEEDGFWRLTVLDRGVGLPEGFRWTEAEGLGLTIIRSLAAKLDGDVDVSSDGGTRLTLRMPKPNGRT
ncbi:MAG: hypothetical protein M0006_11490 [Magnetospirillum sp.]|nr:hypothetical protein [Magnetospirillum sp.]